MIYICHVTVYNMLSPHSYISIAISLIPMHNAGYHEFIVTFLFRQHCDTKKKRRMKNCNIFLQKCVSTYWIY